MKMTLYFSRYDLEALMKQILSTAVLVGIVVFMAGVIWGWWYALFIAAVILLGLSLLSMAVKR